MSDITETKDSLIQNTINDIETINKVIEGDKASNDVYATQIETACTEEGEIIENLIAYAVHDNDYLSSELIERYRKVVAANISRSKDRVKYANLMNTLIIEANNSTIKVLASSLEESKYSSYKDKLNDQLAYLSNLRKNTNNKPILDDIEVVVDALIREFINNNFGDILNISTEQ